MTTDSPCLLAIVEIDACTGLDVSLNQLPLIHLTDLRDHLNDAADRPSPSIVQILSWSVTRNRRPDFSGRLLVGAEANCSRRRRTVSIGNSA